MSWAVICLRPPSMKAEPDHSGLCLSDGMSSRPWPARTFTITWSSRNLVGLTVRRTPLSNRTRTASRSLTSFCSATLPVGPKLEYGQTVTPGAMGGATGWALSSS